MQPLNGLILAGGRSERMGQDKAGFDYHGTAQTHHLANVLAPFVNNVFVSIREAQSTAAYVKGLQTITDYYVSPSPLNGIVSAMRMMPGASFLVVAIDMPYIDVATLKTLTQQRDSTKVATCFESPAKGGPDPLLALWEGHAFETLATRLDHETQHVCPRTLLQSLPTHIIKGKVTPHILDNINTTEEWINYKARISQCA